VCYILGIILAVSGMVTSSGLVGFSVVILILDTAVIILGSVQVYFLWKESISTKILEASKCTELISYMCILFFRIDLIHTIRKDKPANTISLEKINTNLTSRLLDEIRI
jgi:hypothetical protein